MSLTPHLRSRAALAALASVVLLPTAGLVGTPASGAAPELTRNGSFERGVDGWRTNNGKTTLRTAAGGPDGNRYAVLGSTTKTTVVLNDRVNTVPSAEAGDRYEVTAWLRSDVPRASGQLRVREVGGRSTTVHATGFHLTGTRWTRVELEVEVAVDSSTLDLNVLAWKNPARRHLHVDGLSMTPLGQGGAQPAPQPEPEPEVGTDTGGDPAQVAGQLQNGCDYTHRGIPSCGAYFGGATGSNTDPGALEAKMGSTLGVRRTFFQASQVSAAVETARRDLARGRLPWISFKLPYSWADMAHGRGDAWTLEVARRLDGLDGPVWVAFHHEPENDTGPIAQWTQMQERLGPIVRQNTDNVGFSVIVMGWHQLYGAAHLRFASMWPDTKIDVAGFDVYNFQGMPDGAGIRTKPVDLDQHYFTPLREWAKRTGTPWGLAETGYTNYTAEREPQWILDTFRQMKRAGGIAFSYFNSALNSKADWTLSTGAKERDYQAALSRSARLPAGGA